MAKKPLKDYRALFQAVLAHQNPKKFVSEFKKSFRTIKNFKWAGWHTNNCSDVTDAKGSTIPIWDIIKTLDDPSSPRFKGALIFLLNVDWYKGLPKGQEMQEGPACWGRIYGEILRALEKSTGPDRVYYVNEFLKKLKHIFGQGDISIYRAAEGLESAISSCLSILSQYDLKDPREGTSTHISHYTAYGTFDSLEEAYKAIRYYYHVVLIKQNLVGDEILAKILEVMKRAYMPSLHRKSVADFLVFQIPVSDLTQPYLAYRRGPLEPKHFRFDDFTCEQLVGLGRPALEAIAKASAYHDGSLMIAAFKYVRKFLDAQSIQELDKLCHEERTARQKFDDER